MGGTLRVTPRQERSGLTVARLVAATQRVLDRVGIEHATTTAIAAEAGVSVGRLYYWFPDVETLVASAATAAFTSFEERLHAVRRSVEGQSFGDALEQLVGVVADVVWSHPGVVELLLVGRRGTSAPHGRSLRSALESCVNDLLAAYVPTAPTDERDVVATVAGEIVVAGTASMLTASPPRAERLEHEVVYALVAYLSSRYPAAGASAWTDTDRPVRPARPAARGAWRHGGFAPHADASR